MMLHSISATMFHSLSGKILTLKSDAPPIWAELTDIAEYPKTSAPGAMRTAFSLFFTVQLDDFPNVQSGHYVIESETLQPVGPLYMERIISVDPRAIRLEAAFN